MGKRLRFILIHQTFLACLIIFLQPIVASTLLPEQTPVSLRYLAQPVLLLHGLPTLGHAAVDCGATWDHAKAYLQQYHDINGTMQHWQGPIIEIKNYTGDTHCDADIHSGIDNPFYHRCDHYYYHAYQFGANGTTGEDIYHLSCVLAWYIYSYNQRAGSLSVVAHSSAGLVIRNAIYQVAQHKAPQYFPPSLDVSTVVTLEAAHGGIPFARFSSWGCRIGVCLPAQLGMIDPTGHFMNEMYSLAQNPQATHGTTWTMIGSACDGMVNANNAAYMSGGFKHIYGHRSPICPDHGSGLADTSDQYDELMQSCSTCGKGTNADPPPGIGYYNLFHNRYWHTTSMAPHYLHAVLYALYLRKW